MSVFKSVNVRLDYTVNLLQSYSNELISNQNAASTFSTNQTSNLNFAITEHKYNLPG